jgi:hypothetical protein
VPSKDYDKGYAEGAGATARVIRDRLLRAIADGARSGIRTEVLAVVAELNHSFGLEKMEEGK